MNRSLREAKNAIVIGGSISGLLAARVLSDLFQQVTIVERDQFPADPLNRKGVPQGWHAHGLLASGSQILEELFPGLGRELAEHGVEAADVVNDGHWFFEGGSLARVPSETMGWLVSRPLLEFAVRERVRGLNGVRMLEGCAVRQLVMNDGRVCGVRTDSGEMCADLVIDASGRGSRTPKWLESLGFPLPPTEEVEVRLAYSTRYFQQNPESDGMKFAVAGSTIGKKESGVIISQEGGRWVVTLIGRSGLKPPTDLDGFLEFAKGLDPPYIYDAVRTAEPIGEASTMAYPASRRRRYEKLRRFPRGFLVFGDSICSFNPTYGQGISVAARQAIALRGELQKGESGLAQRFFRAASRVIDTPWNIAVGGDLRLPDVHGKRPLRVRLMNRYIAKLHKLAHQDGEAAVTFLRVAQLLDEPSRLLRPRLLFRLLMSTFRKPVQQAARLRAAERVEQA